ncbi:hypothetical protein AGR4C_pb10007 [Agrobacterium tumefaciens str. Kerr 14]|uniref:Uncharacterized protein n=1 Tax=Agrobacterium tumefaciens str. Kerr 14 TaxID=1183424 RepID=A0A1S7SDC4_AGRTU|nr:hypothetical protein AGR4C_pb10007 [Agrobacterium tumefaciens str. Kerr 14]
MLRICPPLMLGQLVNQLQSKFGTAYRSSRSSRMTIANLKTYESGMSITYDRDSCVAMIAFRGLLFQTEDLLKDQSSMQTLAEDFCRSRGWRG